jgi:predicted amidophosphoribosyltransferase
MCQTTEDLETCTLCDGEFPESQMVSADALCMTCWDETYRLCGRCGEATEKADLRQGLCPDCREAEASEVADLIATLKDSEHGVKAAMAFLKGKGYTVAKKA